MPRPPDPLPHSFELIAEGIWQVDQRRWKLGVHFPNRMTIVRLSQGPNAGCLWVHSPVSIDEVGERLRHSLAWLATE